MIKIIAFDFQTRIDEVIDESQLAKAVTDGKYIWIDAAGPKDILAHLDTLGLSQKVIEEALGSEKEGDYDLFPDCLHIAMREARLENGKLIAPILDVLLNSRCLITLHSEPIKTIAQMLRTYREDFLKFSKSPGFLLYELADHLIQEYRNTMLGFNEAVAALQLRLFENLNDEIFRHVSELTGDILTFKKIILSSRELMKEMATRRSHYVSETTQPYLELVANTLERLGDDLSSQRDVLAETLDLYMGMVGYRTNRVLIRLTIISMIFLPLTFLAALFAMDFELVSNPHYSVGYVIFGISVGLIVAGLLITIKRLRWMQ